MVNHKLALCALFQTGQSRFCKMLLFSSPMPDHTVQPRATALWAVALFFSGSLDVALADPGGQPSPTQLPQVVVTSNRLLASVRPFSSSSQPHPETLPNMGTEQYSDLQNGLGNVALIQGVREPYSPFFEIDWSVGLRASRTAGTNGAFYGATLLPQISATRTGLRSSYVLGAQARLGVNSDQLTRIEQLDFTASGQYELDRVSRLTGNAGLTLSQDDPNAPGTSDQIVQTPLVARGQIEGSFLRQFGRLGLSLGANFLRQETGDTKLVGDLRRTNKDRNTTRLGADLRLQYELTPIIDAFVEGAVARDWFDAPPARTRIFQDGWDYSLSAGLAGNWRDVFVVEASLGYGLRRFEDVALDELASTLYAASLTYSPSDAFAFDAQLSTTLTPENKGAGDPASVDYAIAAGASFQVAPWVGLRGSLSQSWDVPVSGSERNVTFSTGVGADFALNKNAALSLDYLYTRAQNLPAEPEDAQEVAVSLTWSK